MKKSSAKNKRKVAKGYQISRIPPISYMWIWMRIKRASLFGRKCLYVNYISHENACRLWSKGFEVYKNRYPNKSMISW